MRCHPALKRHTHKFSTFFRRPSSNLEKEAKYKKHSH